MFFCTSIYGNGIFAHEQLENGNAVFPMGKRYKLIGPSNLQRDRRDLLQTEIVQRSKRHVPACHQFVRRGNKLGLWKYFEQSGTYLP